MEQPLKQLYILHIPLIALLAIQAIKPSHAFVIDFTLASVPIRVLMLQRGRIIKRSKSLLKIAFLAAILPVSISVLVDSFLNIERLPVLYYIWNLALALILLFIIMRFVLNTCTSPSLLPDIKDIKRTLRNAVLFIIWCAVVPLITSCSDCSSLWLWFFVFMLIFSLAEFKGRKIVRQREVLPYTQISESYAPVVEDHTGGKIIDDLKNYLIKGKGCLNKKLTEKGLAQALGTNRCYLSRTVNSRLGCSIPIFINMCRIYFACKMMIENPDFTNSYICECCGFSASSTFNNSFKRITGKTPHIWRREAMIIIANTGKYDFDDVFKGLDE